MKTYRVQGTPQARAPALRLENLPWRVDDRAVGSSFVVVGADGRDVARVFFNDHGTNGAIAAARVASAAPDLYAVVAELVEGDDLKTVLPMARAALAKARGRDETDA